MPLAHERLSAARGAMAAACLDALPDAMLGDVTLRASQRRVVARAERALAAQGGCLVAEDVGTGKTFIALALARRWRAPLVIAPASLRSTWRAAIERAGVPCAFASHESLSRGREPDATFDGLIVDESHHFRTPATNRYAVLARLASRAPIVLLSATPLQNRPRDLAAQVALFHGERAFTLHPQTLSRFVIRGEEQAGDELPTVLPPLWLAPDADDSTVLRAILDLPAPPRPLDGGDAGALRCIALVRAWASSRAALTATLRTRRRIATAVAQGVELGRIPTRHEASAWRAAEDVVQLGFPAILMGATADRAALPTLASVLECETAAMERLQSALRHTANPDAARVVIIRRLRDTHAPASIVAFSEYASTITSLFSAMRADAGVGMLIAREARIASGRISRDELLARFAPVAQGATLPRPHERVTLLLATDLLSEGVNLQDASIVLHLDLPWNPARLAQRVGRVRRPGGARVVNSWLLAPPAGAKVLLEADARLRSKLATAERVIGTSFDVMPALVQESLTPRTGAARENNVPASAADMGSFIARLERWREFQAPRAIAVQPCVVAAVQATGCGWLAAMTDGRVLSSTHDVVTDSQAAALELATLTEGTARDVGDDESRLAQDELRAWLAAERLAITCGLDESEGRLRRDVLDWMTTLIRGMRRHEHASAMPTLARLRDRLCAPLPLGTEQLLAELARGTTGERVPPVEALAHAHGILDAAPHTGQRLSGNARAEPTLAALILFGPS